MLNQAENIASYDPELWDAIASENTRQEEHIELIASENYVSKFLERDTMAVVNL